MKIGYLERMQIENARRLDDPTLVQAFRDVTALNLNPIRITWAITLRREINRRSLEVET